MVDNISEHADKSRAANTFDQHVIDSDIGQAEAWSVNLKMVVEEFLHESLESVRRNRHHFDKMVTDAQTHDNDIRQLSTLALANAVADSQSMRARSADHWGTIFDKQVNVNETDALAVGMVESLAKNPVQMDALVTLLVNAVAAKTGK